MNGKALWQLYRKELREERGMLLLLLLALVAWQLFLASRLPHWGVEPVLGLSLMPLGFLPLWVLWQGSNSFRYEWRERTSYLLLSLPASAWVKAAAKLSAIMTASTALLAVILAGAFVFFWPHAPEAFQRMGISPEWPATAFVANVAKMIVPYWAVMLFIATAGQFAFLASRLLHRYTGVAETIVFLVTTWLWSRFTHLAAPLLGWLPGIPFTVLDIQGQLRTAIVPIAPLVSAALFGIGVFALGAWLLERRIDV